MDSSLRAQMCLQTACKDIFELAKSYAYDYTDKVYDRKVSPSEDDIERLGVLEEPMPETPSQPTEILHILHAYGSPAMVAQTGGRYFGFVNGGAIPAALAAR